MSSKLDKEQILEQIIKIDVEKMIGLFEFAVKMIETQQNYSASIERAIGMQDAIDILNDFAKKGREVAKLYTEKKYQELERLMAEEGLPQYIKETLN